MPAPADPTGCRVALLIATSDYRDPALRQLRSPGRDACDLESVLGDPQIGGFNVQTLLNASSGDVQEGIEDFCADHSPDDQLLIYLSCHGVLDDFGRLYYATANTRRLRLAATAVPAAWLNERLEDCRARRQILVLDCCHSGAFARGSKGDPGLALRQRFEPRGRGRVVLTASRSTEYSFEGEQPSGDGVPSVFTRAIIDGLTTGDADRDRDGLITVSDLYRHLYENVRAAEPRQTPELWTYGAEGDLLIAHSVRGAVIEPASLPEDLRLTLESPRSRVRETGVAELAGLLDADVPGLVLTARQALQRIADEDNARVATIARAALHASPRTAAEQVDRELTERARREQQARTEAQENATQQPSDRAPREAEPPEPRTRPEAATRQTGTGAPPPAGHRNTTEYVTQATAQAIYGSASRPSEPRGTAGGAEPPSPAVPSVDTRGAFQVTWHHRLISYRRFWLGLLFILGAWVCLLANVPHKIGYSHPFYNVSNLTYYITLGLKILILFGVLLLVNAVISAVRAAQ